MTFDDFRVNYPEFRQIGDETVKAVLARAASQISQTVWGTTYDAGHGALTAHMLASSALDPENAITKVYLNEYLRMQRQVASGYRVA